MTPLLVITAVVATATLVLIGFAISAIIQFKRTLINVDDLVVNVNKQLDPLLIDLHDTVRQLNGELGSITEITKSVKDIGDKVSATTRIVHEAISSPLITVASISAGAKEAIKKLVGR
ncbi:MAG: DUF948 domain-containing protein [Firmicutes bacterium]|nr:DUF948 domain-containing protein [Bacillota bacterium]